MKSNNKRGGGLRFCWLFLVVLSSLFFRISSAGEPMTGLYLPGGSGDGMKSIPRIGRRNSPGDFSARPAKEDPFIFPFLRRNLLYEKFGDSTLNSNSLDSFVPFHDIVVSPTTGMGIFPKFVLWKKYPPTSANSNNAIRIPMSFTMPITGADRETWMEDPNEIQRLRERM